MGLYPKSKPTKEFIPEMQEKKPEKHFEKIDDTELNASMKKWDEMRNEIKTLGDNIKTLVDEIKKTKGVPEKEEKKNEPEEIIKKQLEDEKGE